MPLLKAKINRALQRQRDSPMHHIEDETCEHGLSTDYTAPSPSKSFMSKEDSITPSRKGSSNKMKAEKASKKETTSRRSSKKKEPQSNKNIVKNYARAMINFGLSTMAMPYLAKILESQKIDIPDFRRFIKGQKEEINSIKKLRELLLIVEEDDKTTADLKNGFRKISEIFIKFFSVNWIFNSKISDKAMHMKYRFKILRRIRNPEHFTYLENFNKTK